MDIVIPQSSPSITAGLISSPDTDNNLLIKTESDIEQGLSCPMLGSITRINMYTHRLYERTFEEKKEAV